jgi:hypothetical protein
MARKMMLRSRKVTAAIIISTLSILFFRLIDDLDVGMGASSIEFFDFVVPGFAVTDPEMASPQPCISPATNSNEET